MGLPVPVPREVRCVESPVSVVSGGVWLTFLGGFVIDINPRRQGGVRAGGGRVGLIMYGRVRHGRRPEGRSDAEVLLEGFDLGLCGLLAGVVVFDLGHGDTDLHVEFDLGFCA